MFVIAFENVIEPGYVTEKIVNGMLAGSIPIYYGTEDVKTLFNKDSFIYCEPNRLEECANEVIDLYSNEERLLKMLAITITLRPNQPSTRIQKQCFW